MQAGGESKNEFDFQSRSCRKLSRARLDKIQQQAYIPRMNTMLRSLFRSAIAPALAAIVFCATSPAQAADGAFVAPLPEEAPPPAPDLDRKPVGFQGIVAQFFQVFRPLQLINPFAPAHYGTGEQNVSDDPDESVPGSNSPGLVVFGVEW